MKLAIQLYSLRNLCETDFDAALKVVSEAGYQGVEFAGFFDIPKESMKEMLDKYNLIAMGSHTGYDLIVDHLDEVIAYNKFLGNNRIVCPGYSLKTEADCIQFCEKMKIAQKILAENGMTLFYHNHSHEFEQDNGKYLMDILAEHTTADELKFELDVYWAYRGGVNPVKFMTKYADRMSIFHMKDGNKYDGTAVGDGEVDVDGVLGFAKAHKFCWAIVEAESGTTVPQQIKDVTASATFMKTVL